MELVHQWVSLHIQFVSLFFEYLKRENVKYFILRNYEELPERNTGKDIDVVIEPGCYATVKSVILKVMKELDIHYYQITQFDRMSCWYIMDNKKQFGIHIDIIENEVYKGFEFYSFDYLHKQTTQYKGLTVLNKSMDTVMLLVQNLVAYKKLKPQYRDSIKQNYTVAKVDIDVEILAFWGKEVGGKLINYLEKSDFDAVEKFAPVLEKTAEKRIFFKSPLKTTGRIIRFLAGKFYRVIWCPKKYWRFFAVEAPDGTGKTTFIDNLIYDLRKYYVSDEGRFCVHHFRPMILPNLGAVGEKAGVMKQDKDFTNPHRAKPSGALMSFVRMVYYWIDYVIGVPLLLRKEVRYEKYTIFDRYIYDFIADPKRARINLPDWVRVTFARMVIKPQIIFVLQADADVIYKRKQELTKEEISRQLIEFDKLKTFGNTVCIIDANKTPEEIVNQAVGIIMEKFLMKV